MQGDADDDGAVVIGAGQGRGDARRDSGGALEGAGEVDLAEARGRGGAGPAATLEVPIAEEAGQLGWASSRPAGGVGGGGDRGLGAVGDAAQVGAEAGGHREAELAEVLIAVFAVELKVKELKAPAEGWRCRHRPGWKGRTWPGQGEPPGPDSRPKCWLEVCSARIEFQG